MAVCLWGTAKAQPLCLSQPQRGFSIDVELVLPEPRIDRSLSSAELSQRIGKTGRFTVHGLHSHGLELRYGLRHAARPAGQGHCFWIERLEVEIVYSQPTIFIASGHRPGGCNDQAIRQHEAEHERVARRTFQYTRPGFGDALARAGFPQPSAPLWTEDPEAEAKAQLERIGEVLAPEVERLQNLMTERQTLVDSPTNYSFIRKRCPEW